MNAINVIAPYKVHGQWVFDDPRAGLSQEPFVAGVDTWIDRVVADIPNAEQGFTLIFSSSPFPGHQHRLDWRREEGGGTGIMRRTSIWKAGCVRHFSNISLRRQKRSMRRSKRRADFPQSDLPPGIERCTVSGAASGRRILSMAPRRAAFETTSQPQRPGSYGTPSTPRGNLSSIVGSPDIIPGLANAGTQKALNEAALENQKRDHQRRRSHQGRGADH